MTEQLGRVLNGRYRLCAPIGTGASAQVYLADDVTLRRRVAVKVLHPALAEDEAFLRRFRAEAQAAAALNHANIMSIWDWGEDDGPYLVLEFLGGGSLRAMLDQGRRLTPAQALLVGLDTAKALHYAHSRGFAHRDIKPANLLFGDDGRLRIADFGLARALSEAAWTEPGAGLVGTARYAAPEQATAARVDGKADVYALGLVLIEAVTGSVPLVGESTLATVAGRADVPVPVPAALGPLVPALERAGRPDPAERLGAGAFGEALEAAKPELDRPQPLPLVGAVDVDAVRRLSDMDATLLPPSHPVPSHPVPSHPVPSHPVPSHPVPSHPVTSPVLGDVTQATDGSNGDVTQATNGSNGGGSNGDGSGGETTTMRSGPPTAVFDDLEMFQGEHKGRGGASKTAVAVFDDDPQPTPKARSRRRRWPWLLLVALLVAAAGGGVFAFLQAQPATALVPPVENRSEADAQVALAQVQAEAQFESPWTIEIKREPNEGVPEGNVISQSPSPGAVLEEGRKVTLLVSTGLPFKAVPDLANLTVDEAEAKLVEAELAKGDVSTVNDESVEAGQVLSWAASGQERPEELRKGSEVDLVVSAGPAARTVPNVAGKTADQAVAELKKVGLGAKVAEQYSTSVAAGVVIATEPGAGASVERGTSVTVVVSKGRDLVSVPDIVGRTLDEVNKALRDAGLKPGNISGQLGGSPFTSDPEPGAKVDRNTVVDVFLKR